MKEAADRIIRMDDIDSNILRSIIVLLTVGPLDCDKIVIPLPKLRPMEAFQLMSASTRLLMPDACSKIAHDIDEIADLDLEFYLSAQDHVQTSGPEYQSAWSTACDKAHKAMSLKIEKTAKDPLFSKLSIVALHQVIENVPDLPECWMDQNDVSSGFKLRITEKDSSMSAYVDVTKDNPFRLCLGKERGGLYRFGIRLEESKDATHKKLLINGQSRYFGTGRGRSSFIIKEQWKQLKVCPPCQFSFSARMSVLHRKCFALMNFVSATFDGEEKDCLNLSGSVLVKALQYFNHIEGEPAQKCFAALLDYAALSFQCIIAEQSLMAADASIVCALIERDTLYIEHEEAVLKFVAQWAIKQQEIEEASRSEATSTASMDGYPEDHDGDCTDINSSGSDQDDASSSSYDDVVTTSSGPLEGPSSALISNVEKILKLVRFPFIPVANICGSGAGLTSAERAFLKAVPCYSGLVAEASKLQMARALDLKQPAKKAKNTDLTVVTVPRTFYKIKQIPALDMSALL